MLRLKKLVEHRSQQQSRMLKHSFQGLDDETPNKTPNQNYFWSINYKAQSIRFPTKSTEFIRIIRSLPYGIVFSLLMKESHMKPSPGNFQKSVC
jgi:hypothetical protein